MQKKSYDTSLSPESIIGVLGLGYVGYPLACEFSKTHKVIGFDISTEKIARLKTNTNLKITDDPFFLKRASVFIICVPTPLYPDKTPDLSYIRSALRTIVPFINKGSFVILESTTYPGTTEELVIPELEKSGYSAGIDFGVAYSPERIDPGNQSFSVTNTPKIVGGYTQECTKFAVELYKLIIPEVIAVKDCRTAEAIKMLENIFRNVNIALVNEMATIYEQMGINSWEVISAASSKPYGFMPFYPGPGIGGHCIPLDPYYLSFQAKRHGIIPRFIETAGEINEYMKLHVVNSIEKTLKIIGNTLFDSQITIMGLSYKKNIDDYRESPSIKIIETLQELGAKVKIFDPYISHIQTKTGILKSEESPEIALKNSNCMVFLVDHDLFRNYDIELLSTYMKNPICVDYKNLFSPKKGVIYYGLGKGLFFNKKLQKNEGNF